jgi:hypothetical protein
MSDIKRKIIIDKGHINYDLYMANLRGYREGWTDAIRSIIEFINDYKDNDYKDNDIEDIIESLKESEKLI